MVAGVGAEGGWMHTENRVLPGLRNCCVEHYSSEYRLQFSKPIENGTQRLNPNISVTETHTTTFGGAAEKN